MVMPVPLSRNVCVFLAKHFLRPLRNTLAAFQAKMEMEWEDEREMDSMEETELEVNGRDLN